jgi:undecaprenyl-phosphate 4-deoxy-4-formamido-L-arabinose transferase
MQEKLCPECGAPGLQARAGRLVCALCGRALPAGRPPEFSVVVPVYNSAEILPVLVDRLAKTFAEMDRTFELLLIDDCSGDDSWQVIEALQTAHPFVRAWRLMRNFGQHNALMCGFQRCRGELVVTLDDDLQNPPEEIPKLVAAREAEDLDVVFGYFGRLRHSPFRNLVSRLSRRVIRAAIPGIHPHFSNFRLITRPVVEELAKQRHDFLYTDGLISWITTRASSVEVRHDPRHSGESNYSVMKLVRFFSVALLTFTALPLRLISIAGITSAAVALAFGLVYLTLKLMGDITVPGFAAIIVAVFFLGGIQLFSIGIVAEYIAKVFLKQSDKPQYIVREGGER